MRARAALGVAATAALIAAGCGREAPPRPAAEPPTPGQRVCRPMYSPPMGFLPTGSMETDEGSYRGLRQSFEDGGGSALVLTAGVRGEFGEGAPAAGQVKLTTGQRADLLGGGTTWILIWDGTSPCSPQTITGNGFTRARFLEILRAMEALAGPEA